MNLDLLLLAALGVVLLIVFWFNKKKVDIQKIAFPIIYLVLYRTKIGLNLMDRIAKKYSKLVNFISVLGIYVGFFVMLVIFYFLIKGTYNFLFVGGLPPIAPLLPGIKPAAGIPSISFIHWIIAIFVLAGVHEFSHGLVARLHDVKLKSSGFAVFSILLPIVPAAFVEPDEEQLKRKSKKSQLAVLAAGSWSNFITAGIFFLISLFVMVPLLNVTSYDVGVVIVAVEDGLPAYNAGIGAGEKILSINNQEIKSVEEFIDIMIGIKEGDNINIKTDKKDYNIVVVKNPTGDNGYIGVSVTPEKRVFREGLWYWPQIVSWLSLLIGWIFIANLGVGLFNLLPLGPVDGGRMFYLVSLMLFRNNEDKAKRLWLIVSFFTLALIAVSILPWFFNLFSPLLIPITSLFG